MCEFLRKMLEGYPFLRNKDHLGKKDKSNKRKSTLNMAPHSGIAEDINGSRRNRRLTNSSSSSSELLHRPQRSASLCKPSRPVRTEPAPHNDNRVDVLTARTKEALLKVERLKIRRVASTAKSSADRKSNAMTERPSSSEEQHKPISILKRKSGTCSLPVTFSPEVVLESERIPTNRQGILKKRLSMEEVPNVRQVIDTRGRRSSLDASARTHGILKRRTSRSEDEDFTYSSDNYGEPLPHGILKGGMSTEDCGAMRPILKRRSHSEDHHEESRDSSPEPHHGILKKGSDHHVGLSYSEGCLQYQLNQDTVKPILKKKSLSEESATASSVDFDIPRPILKKKSSTESDEADEYRPRRPILKSGSSRASSRTDERESPRRTPVGFSDDQPLPQDLAAALNDVVQRRNSSQNQQALQRTKSAAAADSELASILMKRRSVSEMNAEEQMRDRSIDQGIDEQQMETRRRNSSSPTPVSESIAERISRLVGGASAPTENGAVPRRRASDRFRTQPVTFNEMNALNELNAYKEVQGKIKRWTLNSMETDEGEQKSGELDSNTTQATNTNDRTSGRDQASATTQIPSAKEDSGIQEDCCNRSSCSRNQVGCDKNVSDSPVDEGVASDLSSDEGRTARENSKNLELSQKKDDSDRKRKMTRTERMMKSCRIDDGRDDVRGKLEVLLKRGGPPCQSPTGMAVSAFCHLEDGENRKIGRNDAVARRRQANAARKDANGHKSIVKTKSTSSLLVITPDATSQREKKDAGIRDECDESNFAPSMLHGLRRSLTQPLREPYEDEEMPGGATIAERLAALQKSGQNDWRKRVSRLAPDEDVSAIISRDIGKPIKQEPLLSSAQPACILPPPPSLQPQHQFSSPQQQLQQQISAQQDSGAAVLAERLECLETASQGWRRRVAPADATKFSVAGRMPAVEKSRSMLAVVAGSNGAPGLAQPHGSPPDQRRRRCPPMNRFRSRTAQSTASATNTTAAVQPMSTIPGSPFKRSVSAPGGPEQDLNLESGGVNVSVPRADDETFSAFFLSATETPPSNSAAVQIDAVDLDAVSKDSRQMLVLRRTVQAQRGRRAGSRNPVRALARRDDLRDSYAEVRTDVADRELKRLKVEKLAKGSSMAVEALAGLASKEDFTSVNLRKAASAAAAQNFNMLPYKPLMLIQIKGRRHVQARLVEPVASSVNSGDAYVLVTPDEVYLYLGLYSNVIERSRGADIAQTVQQKKDLGCSGSTKVHTINEEKLVVGQNAKKFWSILGCADGASGKPVKAGHPDEDELYESGIVDTNMVYELQGDELVPIEKYWGSIPRISMLDPAKILVFDFGSEMYVWNGKTASLDDRKNALKLTQELWAEGYDYSNCDVCPLNVTDLLGDRGMRDDDIVKAKKGNVRPDWALIGKINQHMETILFREKFLDWPDFSRVIQSKTLDNGDERSADASIDLTPCDARAMIDSRPSLPSLKLENDEVGRGDSHFNEELGRRCEITTVKVTMWRVQEYKSSELDERSLGQFYAGDGYVIRWQYLVSVSGRELGGKPSRHSLAGRDRCAYFCWQGRDATNIDKGAAALLTVQLDEERGPQIRVAQGREPPAFTNLFSGSMIVHEGKRGEPRNDRYRLYMCRGCLQNEAVLEEVPCSMRQLRSRASHVLVDTETGAIVVWHGARTLKHIKEVARAAATKLQTSKPSDLFSSSVRKTTLSEITEGNENSSFFEALGGCNRKLYVSMIKSINTFEFTPRLFHLSSISGTFEPKEILCPLRHETLNTPFPFSQSDLYSVSQPAIFLLDNGSALWLWQGWWPERVDKDDEDDRLLGSDQTGSGAIRWQAERRAAMQTAVDYWKVKHGTARDVKGYLVWAGLEPLEFTNLFPVWQDRDDIAEINMKEGKKAGEPITLQGELSQLTCSTYHPDILLQRPLPEGVDPTRLELYLEPRYFKELLGLTKEEFNELPTWKQTNVKKEKGLF